MIVNLKMNALCVPLKTILLQSSVIVFNNSALNAINPILTFQESNKPFLYQTHLFLEKLIYRSSL